MRRRFDKMEGLGNDFVIFDARREALAMDATLARRLADRQLGIGCDQLILLEPSDRAELRMRIWNHDGSEVQSCGNATRCVVALTGARTIETAGGLLSGSAAGDRIEVSLGEPRFGWDEVPLDYPMDTAALPMRWGPLEGPAALSVGNPHLVFFVPDSATVSLDELGPAIEHDPAFPERINVNVASIAPDGALQLRTWERGAGLTRACGTGACATAVAAIRARRAVSPVEVRMTGGTLRVAWAPSEPIRMTGAATHVFSGEIAL
ncbi:diaminopimelate epimerase [Sphingomonas ginkgonis]|uniref:Diaminopimelate epimerase n=1 Tax=Sphingomonas ginkgonis TaxID=2315330 RepID=A0A3R9WSK0_9SPHN|nr:diaminopimelate epimerase [Sphingomonas ginkgonis]RST30750.1 diaminopimelate epimerase [Sphingomonas ginkgonis]